MKQVFSVSFRPYVENKVENIILLYKIMYLFTFDKCCHIVGRQELEQVWRKTMIRVKVL